MRWVFIRPRNASPYYDPEVQEPLGLQYLAASRRAAADQVLILDAALDGLTEQRLARRALAFRPDVIGYSIMTAQELESVHAIHAEAEDLLAGRPMRWIAGGNLVSTEGPAGLALLPPGLTLVRYEGEAALGQLAQLHRSGLRFPPEIPGDPVPDLGAQPFPLRPYAETILASGWAFNIQGSRGCCGQCSYCSSPGMSRQAGNPWRGRPIDHIADEMAWLHRRYGADSFNFVDEDFLGPPRLAPRRAAAFCEALESRGLKVSFSIQVRPHALDEEICERLARAGLIYCFLGIESDSHADYRRWGRPWVEDPWRFVRRLQRLGIEVNAGVMLFHSHSTLPGIRRFAERLHRHGLLEHRSVTNRQDAMPGSRLCREAITDGILSPGSVGPQHVPFAVDGIEALYRDTLAAINPLGPTGMHALCCLPPLLAGRRLDPGLEQRLRTLRGIVRLHGVAVHRSLGALLDAHERHGGASADLVTGLARRNLDSAMQGAAELVQHRFAGSVEQLRDAIRLDAGL